MQVFRKQFCQKYCSMFLTTTAGESLHPLLPVSLGSSLAGISQDKDKSISAAAFFLY